MANNRVLLIAYDFPPMRVSSGVQRTLKFAQYLSDYGWQAAVLTIQPSAYPATSEDQLDEIPDSVRVERAFGLNAAKQLAISGRYTVLTALPDRWSSWWLGGIRSGKRLIKEFKPDVIWSTYPITTAHMIGMGLKRRTGIPWIAECRDPMTLEGYPADALRRYFVQKVERRMVQQSDRLVFVTQGALDAYRMRYPDACHENWKVISNGYDEGNFKHSERLQSNTKPASETHKITLLHSGVIYTNGRDPGPFLAALAELRTEGIINAENLEVILRATGNDQAHAVTIDKYKLQDIVKLKPLIPYEQALSEMLSAHALMIFQGRVFNLQIPAKLYEYLRAARPVLALTDPQGDTASLLESIGNSTIANIDNKDDIKRALLRLLPQLQDGSVMLPKTEIIERYSRHALTGEFAKLLSEVKSQHNDKTNIE